MKRLLILILVGVAACTSPAAVTTTTESTTTSAPATTEASTTTTEFTTTTPESTTTTEDDTARIEVVYRDGKVVEGGGRHRVVQGSEVEIYVEADVSDHVHVHGYDLFADITPEEGAEIRFTADIPGIFEVELEDRHLLLFELEVGP